MTTASITVIGLGPAEPELRTAAAVRALALDGPLYLRTARHPGTAELLAAGAIALDHHYERAASFAATYAGIVEELIGAASDGARVRYGVPGSPLVLERTVELLRADPRVAVEIVPGLSFLDLAWARLGIDPVEESVRLLNAERFALEAAGSTGPFLLAHTWSSAILSEVKLAFEELPSTEVVLLHHLGLPDEQVLEVDLADLDRALVPDHLTCCYLPQLAAPVATELVRVDEIVRELRVRCPWDAEQTHTSLVRHLLEETYEAIEAIEALGEAPGPEAIEHLEEELGDLLCQVLFHATIAAESGWFNLADVAAGLADKLVRRHPHVFLQEAGRPSPEEVLGSWESAKRAEKGRESLLDGIPPALPALARSAKLERRSAEVGLGARALLDPDRLRGALEALLVGDVAQGGSLLLALGRLVAAGGLDPEEQLRRAATAFEQRFRAAESAAGGSGAIVEVFARLDAGDAS